MKRRPGKPHSYHAVAAAVSTLLCANIFSSALAQSAIEEVIVTAQKREQGLQETPIAISAVSAGTIDSKDIRDISAINNMVPNLRLTPVPGSQNSATIAIRGSVTYNPNLTLEPTVGMYMDGIYIGKSYGAVFDVADLDRIEVLRGPQGTLYGKNTLAGAINLITRQPTGEFGGQLRVGMGNYNLKTAKLDLDLPAIGTAGAGLGELLGKISLSSKRRDGYVDNETLPGLAPADLSAVGGPASVPANAASSSTLGNAKAFSGRLGLLWRPVDTVEVSYSFDYSETDQTPQLAQLTRVGAFFSGPIVPDADRFASSKRQSKASVDQSLRDDTDVRGHALIATWDAGELGILGDVTLKSLTGYRKMRNIQTLDFDGTPYPLNQSTGDFYFDSLSQELQWIGSTDRVEYVFGLYYLEEEGEVDNDQFQAVYGVSRVDIDYGMDNTSKAVYGQLEWTPPVLEDRLTLTFGARYNEEDKEVFRTQTRYLLATPNTPDVMLPPGTRGKKSFNAFSPAFTAALQLSPDISAYIKYSEGWKSGGFNATASSIDAFMTPFDNEVVTEYEIGLKSAWLNNRVRANIALFHDEHKDQQVTQFMPGAPPQSIFTNAGQSTIQGAELELIMIPIDRLELSLNYGYLDAEFDEYMDICTSNSTDCPAGTPLNGAYEAKDIYKVPSAPRNTVSLGITHTYPLPVGELLTQLDWSYTDSYVIYPQPALNRDTAVNSNSLVDARISWRDIPLGQNSTISFSVWGKNLADRSYRYSGIDWTDSYYTFNYFGDPKTYGVDMSITF